MANIHSRDSDSKLRGAKLCYQQLPSTRLALYTVVPLRHHSVLLGKGLFIEQHVGEFTQRKAYTNRTRYS